MTRKCLDCSEPTIGRARRCGSCQKTRTRARIKSPEYQAKVRARSAVYIAIGAGTLTPRPCEGINWWSGFPCGRTPADAHHEDYSRPLEVVWLCKCCHHRRHHELRYYPGKPLIFERPGMPTPDRDW